MNLKLKTCRSIGSSAMLLLFTLFVLQACVNHGFYSTTYIDPKKTFVLGEGRHGRYVAKIKNVGSDDIEIIQRDAQGAERSLGILKVGETGRYEVSANKTTLFKNLSNQKQGAIEIYANGDTNLSMGYKENQ